MKELSVEEKAKRYDEALERAKNFIENGDEGERTIAESIFAGLMEESEDEKIRKEVIEHIRWSFNFGNCTEERMQRWIAWLEKQGKCHISHDDEIMIEQLTEYFTTGHGLQNTNETVVAWLNDVKEKLEKHRYTEFELENEYWRGYDDAKMHIKQGEQKPIIEMKSAEESLGIDSDTYNKIVDECIYGEQTPANKVEPKFKVGDWVTDGVSICQIHFIDNNQYWYSENCILGSIESINKQYHLWTIQNVKDGDVLAEDSCIFIVQKLGDNNTAKTYCTLYDDGDFDDGSILSFDIDSTKPATKEQCEQLEKAMADAGYTFDFEKKEPKKIEQKPAWSEEDEKIIKEVISNYESAYLPTVLERERILKELKSLKDRVQPQPKQEWSEKDEHWRQKAIDFMKHPDLIKATPTLAKDTIDWLKSLKDRVGNFDDGYKVGFSAAKHNQWKPSLSQLNALGIVAKGNAPDDIEEIKSLYKDLKRLLEE